MQGIANNTHRLKLTYADPQSYLPMFAAIVLWPTKASSENFTTTDVRAVLLCLSVMMCKAVPGNYSLISDCKGCTVSQKCAMLCML